MQRPAIIILILLQLFTAAFPARAQEQDLRLERPLIQAIYSKNIAWARYLLKNGGGYYIKATARNGETPLMVAAALGDIQMIKLLLQKGAGINEQNHLEPKVFAQGQSHSKYSRAPAYDTYNRSTYTWHGTVTMKFQTAIPEADEKLQGGTALMRAVAFRQYAAAKLLLERGADVNITGKNGMAALHYAVWNGDEKIIKLLLDKGAAAYAKDAGTILKPSPIAIAAERGHLTVVKLLLSHDSAAYRQDTALSALAMARAAEEGYYNIVALLLQQGIQINTRSADTDPLYQASRSGQWRIVKLLLDKGAHTGVKGHHTHFSPLIAAAENGHLQVAELLLQQKSVAINATDHERRSALMHAVINGDTAMMELLLRYGADRNLTNQYQYTPLMMAVSRSAEPGYPATEVAKLLLEKGADADSMDRWNYTNTLWLAANLHSHNMITLLLGHGADLYRTSHEGKWAFIYSLDQHDTTAMRLMLQLGADIDTALGGNVPRSPLMWAAQNGDTLCMRWLLANGADINARNSQGQTALMWAAQRYNGQKAVELLLAHGAAADAVDKNGLTTIMHAGYYINEEVLKLLLAHGADINARDAEGKRVLDRYPEGSNPYELLKRHGARPGRNALQRLFRGKD